MRISWFNFLRKILILSTVPLLSIGQNIGISPTGALPDNSAGLDVNFNNKGILIPRVALQSINDNTTIPNPAHSLLVFNTGLGGLVPEGFYYNAGTPSSPKWIQLLTFMSPTYSNAWLVNGNSGTNPVTNFIGTIDSNDLVLKTNSQERIRIKSDGKVGIGTSTITNNAILQVSSPNKGVMFPKVSLSNATDNITIPVSSPSDDGLIVYNTSTSGTGSVQVVPGYYYWQNNRWNRFMSNAYSGAIFGTLASSTPNHLYALYPSSWQYTKAYIDLPPGKWIVFVFLFMVPGNASGNLLTGGADIYCRLTFSDYATSFVGVSPDVNGSPFVGGTITTPAYFDITKGTIVINNSTNTIKRYYLWGQILRFGTSPPFSQLLNFATTAWGENQFFAIPAN
ncbi:MAG: hypothetical protein Fur0023_12260 [Bacteroidia bacterium]